MYECVVHMPVLLCDARACVAVVHMPADQLFDAPSAFSVHVKRFQTPSKLGDDGWRSVHVDGVTLEEWRHRYQERADAGGAGGGAQRQAGPAAALMHQQQQQLHMQMMQQQRYPQQQQQPQAMPTAAQYYQPPPKQPAGRGAGSKRTPMMAHLAKHSRQSKRARDDDDDDDESEESTEEDEDEVVEEKDEDEKEEKVDDEDEEEEEEAPQILDAQRWVQCTGCETWRVVPDEHWPRIETAGDEDWFCRVSPLRPWNLESYPPLEPSSCRTSSARC